MRLSGEIRKITWGIIPNPTFSISVEQTLGGREKLQVVQIVKEISESTELPEFHVECREVLSPAVPNVSNAVYGEPFIWKTYHKVPDEVEYFKPDVKHDYKKA
jgi:hypothetical protein